MHRRISIFVILISLLSCNYESNVSDKNDNQNTVIADRELYKILEEELKAHENIPGLILHIESPLNNISWTGAIGLADTNGRELKFDDPVLIASNTKTYVAASIMRLIEMDKATLHQPINELISEKTDSLLLSDGYDTKSITLAHLMSHTSGIFDYVETKKYLDRTTEDPGYVWSKWEQMELSVTDGDPLDPPEYTFRYSDMNYLILTEVIERLTGQPFYTAMRELLKYDELGMEETWFNILEEKPEHLSDFAHQFASEFGVDSYSLHGSFDLYGGGGIASTARDMALFYHGLFEGKIFDQKKTLDLMHTNIQTQDSVQSNYFMGFDERKTGEYTTKGHGGFWGTVARYNEKLHTTISVIVLERDAWTVCFDITENLLKELDILQVKSNETTSISKSSIQDYNI